MPVIELTSTFVKALNKLPPDRAKRVKNAVMAFQENPDRPGLRLHKLEGIDIWSLSAGRKDRIVMEMKQGADEVTWTLLDVGAHDHVYRRMNRR